MHVKNVICEDVKFQWEKHAPTSDSSKKLNKEFMIRGDNSY